MEADKAQKRSIQEKLNKQYIDQKINPIIEPMAVALFQSNVKSKDEAVSQFIILLFSLKIEFMVKYIKDNFGNRPSINEGEKMELEYLRKELNKTA